MATIQRTRGASGQTYRRALGAKDKHNLRAGSSTPIVAPFPPSGCAKRPWATYRKLGLPYCWRRAESGSYSAYPLYALYVIAGIGAALIYGGCMGSALKWFTAQRGLAAGLIAAGFVGGTALHPLHRFDHQDERLPDGFHLYGRVSSRGDPSSWRSSCGIPHGSRRR